MGFQPSTVPLVIITGCTVCWVLDFLAEISRTYLYNIMVVCVFGVGDLWRED